MSDEWDAKAREVVTCRCGWDGLSAEAEGRAPVEYCNHVGFDEVAEALRAAYRRGLEDAAARIPVDRAARLFEEMNRERKQEFLDWLSGNYCLECGGPFDCHCSDDS